MSDLGKAAQARRLYLHVHHGGSLTPTHVSLMIQVIEQLEADNARLREALTPFAFLDDETTQHAWEARFRDRFKDWIDFDDMEAARAALESINE